MTLDLNTILLAACLIAIAALVVFVLLRKRTAYLGPVVEELQKEKAWLRRGEYNAAMVKGRQNLELLLKLVAENNGIQLDNTAQAVANAKEEAERQSRGGRNRGHQHGRRREKKVMTHQQFNRWMADNGYLDRVAKWEMNQVRIIGNKAVHENYADKDDAWNQYNYLEDILKTVTEVSQKPAKRHEAMKKAEDEKKKGGRDGKSDGGKKSGKSGKQNDGGKKSEKSGKQNDGGKKSDKSGRQSGSEKKSEKNAEKKVTPGSSGKNAEKTAAQTSSGKKSEKAAKQGGAGEQAEKATAVAGAEKKAEKAAKQSGAGKKAEKAAASAALPAVNAAADSDTDPAASSEPTKKKRRRRKRVRKPAEVVDVTVVATDDAPDTAEMKHIDSDADADAAEHASEASAGSSKKRRRRRRRSRKPAGEGADVQTESAAEHHAEAAETVSDATFASGEEAAASEPGSGARKRRRRRRSRSGRQAHSGEAAVSQTNEASE